MSAKIIRQLFSAAGDGDFATVKKLLETNQVEVSCLDSDQRTALHLASANGQVEVCRLLLDQGAKINATQKDKWTPLHYACWGGFTDVARLLLDKGANINAKEATGQNNALFLAAKKGHVSTAKLLIEKGIDTEAQNQAGATIIQAASFWRQSEIIELLEAQEQDEEEEDIDETVDDVSTLDPTQVAEWSVDDVCQFLKQAKIDDDVIDIFRTEKIKGKSLAKHANDDILKSIGIKASGDREDISAAIGKLFNSSTTAAATTKGYDVFVSYRRAGGSNLAYIVARELRLKGFNVFYDVGSLSAGDFEQAIGSALKSASCVVLVMSPGALDRCLIKNDPEGKDWVRKEIVMALKDGKQLLPILDPYFTFPEPEELPEDMRRVTSFNGVKWNTEYSESALEKLEKFIKDSMLKH